MFTRGCHLTCCSHTVLVQDVLEGVPGLLGVGVKVKHVPHYLGQPVGRVHLYR